MNCDKDNCPYVEFTTTAMTSVTPRKLEHMEFIFQQRLSLFNTRRDHEWKIFFNVLFLLGAVDWALLTVVEVQPYARIWWPAAVVILFAASCAYQWGVQTRNHADRRVMDAICAEILADLPLADPTHKKDLSCEVDCSVTQKSCPEVFHVTYLWAFICEMIVLSVACILSALIPFVTKVYQSSDTLTRLSFN